MDTKMIDRAKFTMAFATLGVYEDGKDLIFWYETFCEYEDRDIAMLLGEAAMHLNNLSEKIGCGSFLTADVRSDDDVVALAQEVFDAINEMVANACRDAYTMA